ncbi:membrane-spanning 4-domains subfamily A member 5-like isoform X1 [Branchiostoma floridae]|uniref:Membrane-spanning 4-domains subfamily A member 5-like isoform X1 n=1 Tax=Branchiostoma floridae TaxID=7739 RepID=A0A9J7KDE1_BRAFL|nr:membrane-spanning 4-domains subfamily A member 5-like isoform X1 [Branchiostoma floridae]
MCQQQQPARTPKCFGNSAAKALSITQVVCGGLAIVFGIVIIVLRDRFSFTGYPIWIGALFLSTGIVGIFAAVRKTTCMIITFMVLSIVSAVFTIIMLQYSATAIFVDLYIPCRYCNDKDARLAINALLVILALLEAGLSITSSVMTCCAVCPCCRCDGQGHQPPAVAYQMGADGRLAQIIVPGQYVMQGGQPIAMTPLPPNQTQYATALPPGATALPPGATALPPGAAALPSGATSLPPRYQPTDPGAPAVNQTF